MPHRTFPAAVARSADSWSRVFRPRRSGPGRTGNFNFSGHGRFFSPFGGDGTHAVQAQGEYMYYSGRQEGQFDIGLVNRIGAFQAGAFASFKTVSLQGAGSTGTLAQGSAVFDYIFSFGKIGVFGHWIGETTAGQLIVGRVVSSTTTVCEQLAWLPEQSVTVQVRVTL